MGDIFKSTQIDVMKMVRHHAGDQYIKPSENRALFRLSWVVRL
jgi:hypothetical protein